ncbi:MAG: hypothetical protein HRT88_11620, partial [Lentisphaeraceae bacterium]|nr:hypothetical protein [Lentisphaeraceae bacterium]
LGNRAWLPVSFFIFSIAQYISVIQGRSQRRGVLKSDDWLESNLGFAGREHD